MSSEPILQTGEIFNFFGEAENCIPPPTKIQTHPWSGWRPPFFKEEDLYNLDDGIENLKRSLVNTRKKLMEGRLLQQKLG